MKVTVRKDKVIIDGYVNAVERFSRPLYENPIGWFVEKVKAGVFAAALKRAKNVEVLLNHDESRILASTSQGTATLKEDNVGLRATVEISDPEVIEDARNGKLRGWSFGFSCDDDVRTPTTDDDGRGLVERIIKALTLYEVSIINDKALPAYVGTSIEARAKADDGVEVRAFGEDTEVDTTDETADGGEETTRTTETDQHHDDDANEDEEAKKAAQAVIDAELRQREADIRLAEV